MKIRSTSKISLLIILGLTAGIDRACAYDEYLKQVEGKLSIYAKDKDLHGRYAGHLYYLAHLYRLHGMREKSMEAFQKYLVLWRQMPQTKSEARFLLEWAQAISRPWLPCGPPTGFTKELERREKIDQIAASKLADDALALASKMPPTSAEKIKVLLMAAVVYKRTGESGKKQLVIDELDRRLQTMEQEKKPSEDRVMNIASSLSQLSEVYYPMDPWQRAMTQSPMGFLSDTTSKEYGVRISEFRIAEAFRQRAMAQANRLPARDKYRIDAQRSIAVWYRYYGQSKQYNDELAKLICMIGSTDLKVLFPPPRCLGCGMG